MSLTEQRDAIVRYASRYSLEIVSWFEERETAAKRGRPIFSEMLRLLRRRKAAGVIIHKIDRSARNLRDWADLGEMIDAGIDVHFANESLDLHTRGGRLSADIQAVVAADYIRNLREETRKGFYGRLKQGLYPMRAPVGYLDMGKGNPKEPDPIQGRLIRTTFELYAAGQWNLETLTAEMYRRGLRSKRGGPVSLNGMSKLLNNPFYIGLIRLRSTGETFAGQHQPLVSKSLFDRVQAVLRGKTNTRSIRHGFLFRRLVICAQCGFSLIGELQKGRVYYRCHSRTCRGTSIREDAVHEAVSALFHRLMLSDDEKAYVASRLGELTKTAGEDRTSEIQAMTLRLSQLKGRLNRLTDAFIDRMLEPEIFEDRKSALLHEQKSVEETLEALRTGDAVPIRLSIFLELASGAYLSYQVAEPDGKRELLALVTSNRTVNGKNIDVKPRIPFREVADRAIKHYAGPYRDTPRTVWDTLLPRLIKLLPADSFLMNRLLAASDRIAA